MSWIDSRTSTKLNKNKKKKHECAVEVLMITKCVEESKNLELISEITDILFIYFLELD